MTHYLASAVREGVPYRRFERSAPECVRSGASENGLQVGTDGSLAVLVDLGAFASRIGEPGGDLIASSK